MLGLLVPSTVNRTCSAVWEGVMLSGRAPNSFAFAQDKIISKAHPPQNIILRVRLTFWARGNWPGVPHLWTALFSGITSLL